MAHYPEGTEQQRNRAYSPAVVTEGGRIVWMAGQTATVDANGVDISGNFEAQTHRVFELMDETLRRAGGTLANLVTMTVFVKEPRYGDRFVEIRKEKFLDGRDHHRHELRAARDGDRDPGDRRDRRPRVASQRRAAPSARRPIAQWTFSRCWTGSSSSSGNGAACPTAP
jgi:enamine deaminase RidA (YjgF/YER057c/UK114 family)